MRGLEPTIAYEYDDLDLVQRTTDIAKRDEIDCASPFSRRLMLKLPVVSAAMDTATGADLAIVMAEEGGLGVLHRACTIDEQVRMALRVKRAARYVIEDPRLLTPKDTVADAYRVLDEYGVGGILVVETRGSRKLLGVLSRRDLHDEPLDRKVGALMNAGGKRALVTAAPDTALPEARRILHAHRIEKLPLVNGDGILTGLVTESDVVKVQKFPNATRDAEGRLVAAAAIGIEKKDCYDRAEALAAAGVDVLVIDVAHGGLARVPALVRELSAKYPDTDIVAGNVMSEETISPLLAAGVAGVKAGIAPGYACRTRDVTGVGGGQLTVISECAAAVQARKVPICADGGIRHYGDIGKGLAAGASTVMVGSLFAGTVESPGEVKIREDGTRVKVYRGMASASASKVLKSLSQGTDTGETLRSTPEGAELEMVLKGSVREVLWHIEKALRSTMSYIGAQTVADMPAQAIWRRKARSGQSK